MATATLRPRLYLRCNNLFFSGMAAVALFTVLVGFARTYFLAGLFRAPLPNLLVHIHGAAFTLWIILFITQISLVTARRVDLHRRLGLLGFVLAVVMILLGTVTASDRLARHVAQPGMDTTEEVRAFYSVPLADMLMFHVRLLRLSQPFPTSGAQAADVVRDALASGRGFRPLAGL